MVGAVSFGSFILWIWNRYRNSYKNKKIMILKIKNWMKHNVKKMKTLTNNWDQASDIK